MSLWEDFLDVQVSTKSPPQLRHHDLVGLLGNLHSGSPEAVELSCVGQSYEGRSIPLLKLGTGPVRIFAWSQMHGNEPTHTAVLLALVNLLLSSPKHPTSKAILSGCTLFLLPMLNPDGVERTTRRNAQDIDINRDALHLQSPEGKLLNEMVKTIQPHFALNLHNQKPRTSVHTTSQQVAAVSLLVPPINRENTETDEIRRAKQVAVSFLQAVRPYCEGMISRYDADFMPRCFGEWVQQQGVPTLTVEAGGWTMPNSDLSQVVQLHFTGLVSALEAIATGRYLQEDPAEYDTLPRSAEHDLFDLLLRGITVANGGAQTPFVADLGINLGETGQIEDLGDLCITSGKISVDGTKLICVPGKIVYAPEISPCKLPDQQQAKKFLARGVTSVIGQLDLAVPTQLDALIGLKEGLNLPVNLGFIAVVPSSLEKPPADILERLIRAASLGLLGVIAKDVSEDIASFLQYFKIPRLNEHDLVSATDESIELANLSRSTWEMANLLGLKNRGSIKLGMEADLLLLKDNELKKSSSVIPCSDLQQVMVAGTVVFNEGELLSHTGGRLLTSRFAE